MLFLKDLPSNLPFPSLFVRLPHGRSWRINNPKSFEERVIPVFFRHGRYTSFARQVNGWGFRRITHGNDFNSYYHEVSYLLLLLSINTGVACLPGAQKRRKHLVDMRRAGDEMQSDWSRRENPDVHISKC